VVTHQLQVERRTVKDRRSTTVPRSQALFSTAAAVALDAGSVERGVDGHVSQ